MVRVRWFWLVLCALGCLVLGVFLGRYVWEGSEQLSVAQVIGFCDDVDRADRAPWIEKLQRSEEFAHIVRHLPEYLELGDELIADGRIWLPTLVWRAALFAGNDQELAAAFNIAVLGENRDRVVADIAGNRPRQGNPAAVLRHASNEAMSSFLYVVADRDPSQWGRYDYTDTLVQLMRNAEDENLRLHAAYCMARWKGEAPLGEEAMSVLRAGAEKENPLAIVLLDAIESLGREGWKEPE